MRIIQRFLFCIILPLGFTAFGQEVFVKAEKEPLTNVLLQLRDQHQLQLSFNHRQLSRYIVSMDYLFPSPQKAVDSLIYGFPLTLEQIGEVIVIVPQKRSPKSRSYSLNGKILDATSGEPLPYSHITINSKTYATDLKGSFSHITDQDSVFKVKTSHLGYYILDTVLTEQQNCILHLSPSSVGLKEVVIKNREVEKSTQIGAFPALMKVNHKIAHFLPGYGDNSVFNLLRLLPGITAAGEQTNDLIIWGSYAGQSQVLFDGFPVYGLKNFNDNISAFNPLVAKDIEIHKGGYDTRFGERVGGIVNITGKNGNMQRPSFTVSLNNMTLNALVEIPMFKRSSLVLAFRHTYYNLYNPNDMNFLIRKNNDADTTNDVDVNIVPDYVFRDANIKYSINIAKNDLMYVSLYGGNDRFSYNINEPYQRWTLLKDTREENNQFGGTIFYGKSWKGRSTTNFSLSYSGIESRFNDDLSLKLNNFDIVYQSINKASTSKMTEMIFKAENRISLNSSHTLEANTGFYYNEVALEEDTFGVRMVDIQSFAQRFYLSAQDVMALGKKVILKAGMRLTYAFNLNRWYAEPRVSLSVSAGDHWKFNAAWGIYDQFINKSSTVDELGNYRYIWTVSNNETIPVVQASHFVLGTSFHNKGWTLNIEPFFKRVYGITRYFFFKKLQIEGILNGESRTIGIDFFIQKDFLKHAVWVAYTLGRTDERFPDLPNDDYRRAYHDQRHEIKAALMLNFDPFYFSTNYVYGSGFPVAPYPYNQEGEDLKYSRWDVSFVYKFLDRKVMGELGLSILNVLNTQNIKYTNFERIPGEQNNSINIYAEAIPITPALYLKISM